VREVSTVRGCPAGRARRPRFAGTVTPSLSQLRQRPSPSRATLAADRRQRSPYGREQPAAASADLAMPAGGHAPAVAVASSGSAADGGHSSGRPDGCQRTHRHRTRTPGSSQPKAHHRCGHRRPLLPRYHPHTFWLPTGLRTAAGTGQERPGGLPTTGKMTAGADGRAGATVALDARPWATVARLRPRWPADLTGTAQRRN
jgi:hypothetical protein